jgi:asparagine synthase (glutamine-hydrolysing)
MCGFFLLHSSLLSSSEQEQLVIDSLERMRHRGPDNLSISSSNDITFGHVRLSIQDLSVEANQPFISPCGRYTLCFNGEIYNTSYLKPLLFKHGIKFKTANSDTEVLLYWLICYGTSRLNELDGEWSFAFYDRECSRLTISRDRVGTKPLYYLRDNNSLIISSELKPILLSGFSSCEISANGLESYFVHGASVAPFTVISDVFKLGAGEVAEISQTDFIVTKWWRHESSRSRHIPRVLPHQCKSLVSDSVLSRTISDVPFGILFSGGVDSSIVASTISKQSGTCHTYTVGFSPPPPFDEAKKAKFLSQFFDTEHHELIVKDDLALLYIQDLLGKYDVPLSDWVNLPLYLISRKAKQDGFSVLIAGEGADELFLGYPAYFRYMAQDWFLKLLKPFHPLIRLILQHPLSHNISPSFCARFRHLLIIYQKYGSSFISNSLVFSPHELDDAFENITVNHESYYSRSTTFERIRKAEFTIRLPELLLMRVDSMTMCNSVESRVPFLSSSLLDTILGQRLFNLAPWFRPKYLLKQAFSSLPSSVLWSPKIGFGTPVPDWFTGDFQSIVFTSITSINAKYNILNSHWVSNLFTAADSKIGAIRNRTIWQIWTIYVFMTWYNSVNYHLSSLNNES